MGFLVICSGVVLLQLSKSAKDVPDAAIFKGDLDQVREVAEQEASEAEPKADAIRGAASIIRRLSTPRRQMEQLEAKRIRDEKLSEHLEPLKENEVAEWDGLRRRKTVIGNGPSASPIVRRKTLHPPLGMSQFPEDSPEQEDNHRALFAGVKERAQTMFHIRHGQEDVVTAEHADPRSPTHPVAMTNINFPKSSDGTSPALPYGPGSFEEAQEHIYGHRVNSKGKPIPSPRSKPLPKSPAPTEGGLQPPQDAKRQFSFSNFLRHSRQSGHSTDTQHARPTTAASYAERKAAKNATEEERMGLTKGDSSHPLMGETSPERQRQHLQPIPSRDSQETPETASLYDNFTYTRSQRNRRSASPDAYLDEGMQSDDDYQEPRLQYHEPFSFSSAGPATTQQRPPSRRRPSPPAVYTPPQIPSTQAVDYAQQIPSQQTHLVPPSAQALRRVTIGEPTQTTRSALPLDPPINFGPTTAIQSHSTRDQNLDAFVQNENVAAQRGRPPIPATQQSYSSSDENTSSRERFAEQSARERAERRERAQRRRSQGPASARESVDLS